MYLLPKYVSCRSLLALVGLWVLAACADAKQECKPRVTILDHKTRSEVYFGFDSDRISPDVQRYLLRDLETFRLLQASRLIVTGHTDTAGDRKYNFILSQRRAREVVRLAIEFGFSPGMIEWSGQGETKPMVPTSDGVREVQNRRVTITAVVPRSGEMIVETCPQK